MEVELGPDTTELGLRTGLHSGPTVAGVLRGQRSRFQLFGDSVNTTAVRSFGKEQHYFVEIRSERLLTSLFQFTAHGEYWTLQQDPCFPGYG